jgi:dienelactone hydrolase
MRFAAAIAMSTLFAVHATTAMDAKAPETIEIASVDLPLKAVLYRPEGQGPFPVVVGLHGCEGLQDSSGNVYPQYQDWAQHLLKSGFAVLYPDSYGSRGVGSQCGVRSRLIRAQRERVVDANASRHWLQSQSWAIPGRISLLGWSTGAVSTLWAVRPRKVEKEEGADFRSAAALYPGCRRLDATAWSARIPTLILVAGADDSSPAAFCEHMVAGARGRSARASIVVYPGAYQNFDRPSHAIQLSSGYAFSVDGSGKVHTGTNLNAREDALKRVPQWLAR